MTTSVPFSDERYMQLIAQGLSDRECAMRMRIKQTVLVNEYLPAILQKAGIATREEYVKHVQNEIDEPKGVPAEEINAALRGTKMVQARAFYRALEQHFFQDDCPGCKSYSKYGVLLVKGQFYQHMIAISPVDADIFVLISSLKESDMIHLQQNDDLYRVTFVHLQSKEAENYGDSNI